MASIVAEKKRLETALAEEKRRKLEKEAEGNEYIRQAREDLQKICRVLLQKKLEHEDLTAEKTAIIQEIEMLKMTCDQCKLKCKSKEEAIEQEIKTLQKEIKEFKSKCIQCHECIDTSDVRKFCTDCPRCLQQRECLYDTGDCSPDHTMDCVCQSVKQRFLDNVFENMYTVLENETRTGHGQEVGAAVLDCLKRSRNGKLDTPTKQVLQDFILSTIKKNLNVTIVGGAIKTRCEMDPKTHEQLMLCLKTVQTTKPPKEDKGTVPRKEPCKRWGGTLECNCPKGPNACICTKKAPESHKKGESGPCPKNKEEDNGEADVCPHKDKPCGASCAIRGFSNKVGADVSSWRPDPCKGPTCTFKKNMRAAQCVLGPELLNENAFAKKAVQLLESSESQQQISRLDALSSKSFKRGEKQLKAGIVEKQTGTSKTKLSTHSSQKNIGTHRKVSDLQIQVSSAKILNRSGQRSENQNTECCTSLTRTSSGKMAMELDEKLLEKIEKRTKGSNATFVGLRETNSGNFLIDFNPKHIDSDDSQKVLLKRSVSGKLSLEIDKKLVNSLISDINPTKLNTSSSISIGLVRKSNRQKDNKSNLSNVNIKNKCSKSLESKLSSVEDMNLRNKKVTNLQKVYRKPLSASEHKNTIKIDDNKNELLSNRNGSNSSNGTSSLSSPGTILDMMQMHREAPLTQYLSELDIACQSGKDEIDLKILGTNENITTVKANIKKSPSGNFSLHITDSQNLKSQFENEMGQLSLIKRSESGTYELYLDTKTNSKPPNTILKRNSLGGYSIGFTKSILKSLASDLSIPDVIGTQNIYRINAKAKNAVIEIPAFLKVTQSGNYILILDKEFELEHKHYIRQCFENDTACYTHIEFTNANTVCIDIDLNDENKPEQNALLLRSSSGNLKVYVNGPVFESLAKDTPKSSRASVEMLKKLVAPVLNKTTIAKEGVPSNNKNINNNKVVLEKSKSDTVLYGKDLRNTIKQNEIINSAASLKKTDSGQYAIILNKESKKDFIKSLMNNLSSGVQGHTPVWTGAQSGEITISMGTKDGSLKISPSGNMYALVSESAVNSIISDADDEHTAASKVLKYIVGKEIQFNNYYSYNDLKNTSSHIIKKNKDPKDKCVSTNCRADCRENPNTDCNADTCVCKNTIMDENCDSGNRDNHSKIYFCTHMSGQPYSINRKNNQKCFYFVECTDSSSMMMLNFRDDCSRHWDWETVSCTLPPQLPPFLNGDFM